MTSKRASAHLRRRHTAVSTALMLMAAVVPLATEAAELRVFSTGAPSAAAKVIAAKFSAETGHTVAFTVGQPATIQQKLAAGEQADVVVVPTALIAALENDGKLRVGSGVNVARVSGGVNLVADGKVEVGLFIISEILPVKGVTLVGPLPAEFQSYIVFGAAITSRNSASAPAASFVQALLGPAAREVWMAAGMEPVSD